MNASVRKQSAVLRRLFLALFLRGGMSKGFANRKGAPTSVGKSLGTIVFVYALVGLTAVGFSSLPTFGKALSLHTITFLFLGTFVAGATGSLLFNEQETDVLMHRPIAPSALLGAKIAVIVQVSLWLAFALNLIGFIVGVAGKHGSWRFIPAHALSITLEALFCAASSALLYQLCLRWFGRERLDGVLTSTQVVASLVAITASQLLPRFVDRFGGRLGLSDVPWWVLALPPSWFAGIDDVVSGTAAAASWWLALAAVVATAGVLLLSLGAFAGDYAEGLRTLEERPAAEKPRNRRWLDRAVRRPPLSWWLREPGSRGAFLLVAAYLLRDRDTKLRVYPGIAPLLVFPLLIFFRDTSSSTHDGFGAGSVAFVAMYIGLGPLLGVTMMRYSTQWQASELFRVVPMQGPGALTDGLRRAVIVVIGVPLLVVFAIAVAIAAHDPARLMLFLPGAIALPLYAIVPCAGAKAVPLSEPPDSAQSARRQLPMFGVLLVSGLLSIAVGEAWTHGLFWPMIGVETAVVLVTYLLIRRTVGRARWAPA